MTAYAVHWLVRLLYFTLGALWLLALLPWLMPEQPAPRMLQHTDVPVFVYPDEPQPLIQL